jgi:serine/threonine protein kinase
MDPRPESTLDGIVARPTEAAAHDGEILGGRYHTTRVLKEIAGTRTLLADDTASGDVVVLKELPLEGLSAGARMRLDHEVALLKQTSNDRLAPVLDVVPQDDVLYLVTPFVPGKSLDDRLRDGPLTFREVLTLGSQLFGGLKDAHASRVLHRNVRPGNSAK